MAPISRGFSCRRRGFPVLSAGPTPRTPLEEWTFSIQAAVDQPRSWTWDEFAKLPAEDVTVDIHCVTKWSKLERELGPRARAHAAVLERLTRDGRCRTGLPATAVEPKTPCSDRTPSILGHELAGVVSGLMSAVESDGAQLREIVQRVRRTTADQYRQRRVPRRRRRRPGPDRADHGEDHHPRPALPGALS